ncbi:MAG TPA: hypothetical protein VEW05_02340 [Candidatus Polarisedimenticolia bacterium]|nr:hypothetical protein [Candidatus Polarisedimenticolia bacterium]
MSATGSEGILEEQAVDEGSLASGKQDIVGTQFRLKKAESGG